MPDTRSTPHTMIGRTVLPGGRVIEIQAKYHEWLDYAAFAVEQYETLRADRDAFLAQRDALAAALTLALPYVESALEDKGYKPGAVDRMCSTIRAALVLVEKGA